MDIMSDEERERVRDAQQTAEIVRLRRAIDDASEVVRAARDVDEARIRNGGSGVSASLWNTLHDALRRVAR